MNRHCRPAQLAALVCLVAAVSLAAVGADDEPDDVSPLDELAFMSGTWIMRTPDSVLEETWSDTSGEAMVGMLRWHRDGELFLYELLSVEAIDGAVPVLRLRHFGPGLDPWESEATAPAMAFTLTAADGGTAVFDAPERTSPGRIVYQRDGERLTIDLVDLDEAREPVGAQRFTLELVD